MNEDDARKAYEKAREAAREARTRYERLKDEEDHAWDVWMAAFRRRVKR